MRGAPRRLAVLLAGAALRAAPLAAHTGQPLAPHDLARAWTLEPGVGIALLASAWLYSRGLERLWRRAGTGRGVPRWQAGCFAAGWLTLLMALLSPLHALGGVLFSAHMAQHVLLMGVAAPLLVLGRPLVPFLWAIPPGWRRAAGAAAAHPALRAPWTALTRPLVATLLHAAAIWLWHLPALYQGALRSEPLHVLQHASFLGTALLFWWALVHGRAGRPAYGASVGYLFATALHSGGLGALLTFAPRPWYPAHGLTGAWGLSALEDQQLAGLIMWVPAGGAYLLAALILMAAWMREAERRTVRWQRRRRLVPSTEGG